LAEYDEAGEINRKEEKTSVTVSLKLFWFVLENRIQIAAFSKTSIFVRLRAKMWKVTSAKIWCQTQKAILVFFQMFLFNSDLKKI
jgi:hypothetical protein